MKKTFFLLLFVAVFITSLNASDTSEDYIIEKGDTLWDISDTKLEDSFLWPKLWSVNPYIENPDLIYPGNKIFIPSREELMRMPSIPPPVPSEKTPRVAEPETQETKPETQKTKTMTRTKTETRSVLKSEPKSKSASESESESIFIIPERIKEKYIVNKSLYITSGWIADTFPSVGEVFFSPMDRRLVGKGDMVYIKTNKEAESVKRFFTIRDIKTVKHPITGKKIGHQIRVTGILEVTEIEGGALKATITDSFEDVIIGDGLLPYRELELPLIPETLRTPAIEGYIIETHLNNYLIGEGDIMFLDKGENDGLQVGDVFSVLFSDVFSVNSGPSPERPVGKIQIVSLQPKTSGAVLVESIGEVTIGTKWGQEK